MIRLVPLAFLTLVAMAAAAEPRVVLQLESRELYANLPFTLALQAQGFDETPTPSEPTLDLPGASVTYLGVSPSISQQLIIRNGRRTEQRDVAFIYRWRVQVPQAGPVEVPALTVSQGAQSATSRPARLDVGEIETTRDMIVRLVIPDRAVWVGETFDVEIEWLLSRDVDEFEFVVPLFQLEGVQVEAAPVDGRTVDFAVGARSLPLPMLRDDVVEAGNRYARLRFPARVTVSLPGPLQLEPVRVAARLQAGSVRDRFGFRRPRTQLYQATGERTTLPVRALPLSGRPATFVNAIGDNFSIAVAASRTVVQVGDPIELEVLIRGDGPLQGISLPSLAAAGLPEHLFSVADGAAVVGAVDEATSSKTFKVTARVKSDEVREIPPIQFSYFDPASGAYATIESHPIALAVGGSNVVGATEVEAAPSRSESPADTAVTTVSGAAAVLGVDMALGAAEDTFTTVLSADQLTTLLWLLYGLPLAAAAVAVWLRRTRASRGHDSAITQAAAEVKAALELDAPAREAAPAVLSAVRRLARLTGQTQLLNVPPLRRLETTAYDPDAASARIDQADRDAVLALAAEMRRDQRNVAGTPVAAAILLTVLVAAVVDAAPAGATDPVAVAREAYRMALEENDRVRRIRLFQQAEQSFRLAAELNPQAPSLAADWGNAALGAQDVGRAVLAYRRALQLQPGNTRARQNLEWLRDRMPSWLPRPTQSGAMATLLFWERALSPSSRYLLGAIAFALAISLLTPWSPRQPGWIRKVAVLPALIWLASTGSALFDRGAENAAVLIADGTVLRAADSLGAPAALANPLPAGTEVSVLEMRDEWHRVGLADGTAGWLRAATTARVVLGSPG